MSSDFDPFGGSPLEFDNFDKFDRHENAKDRISGVSVVRIDYDLCEASGACAVVCPEDVIEARDGGSPTIVKPEACTECWICVENCVSGAVEIG